MQRILIIGDSFAANWSADNNSYQGWPQLLAKKYHVINLAQAGCDEYRILQQLKSQPDLDQFDWIIVCHTSSARVHTRQHPVHYNSVLHKNADLIWTDIEHHANLDKKQKNSALISARDFFIHHYDDQYYQEIHQLLVKEIHSIIGQRPAVIVDNFDHLRVEDCCHYLNFNKITNIVPGGINHFSPEGNLKICHEILNIIQPENTLLPDTQIRSLRLAEYDYFTPDDLDCKTAVKNYAHQVKYSFNSRGFRDCEWPETQLEQQIWCVGDSATLGIGSPMEFTWPKILETRTHSRTIKVALAGASNSWIFRQCQYILNEIQPVALIIQWSLLHRRELSKESVLEERWQKFYQNIKGHQWPQCSYSDRTQLPSWIQQEIDSCHEAFNHCVGDEDRRIAQPDVTISSLENVKHTINFIQQLEYQKNRTVLIHSVVPRFASCLDDKNLFYKEIQTLPIKFIPEFQIKDFARDGQHYGQRTSEQFVDQVLKLIEF